MSRAHQGKAPINQRWYEKDFLADTGHLDWLASMIYARLLQKAFVVSSRPHLPDDDAQICNLLRMPAEVWATHRDAVRAFFTPKTIKGVPYLTQNRLTEDWQTIEKYRGKQSELANRRWEKTDDAKADAKACDLALPSTSQVLGVRGKVLGVRNTRLTDLRKADSKTADSANMLTLSAQFLTQTGERLQLNNQLETRLSMAIAKHGLEDVRYALGMFATDDHKWSEVDNPAVLFLSKMNSYLPVDGLEEQS